MPAWTSRRVADSSMFEAPLYWVDAFTAAPFHGNPAAVCLLPHSIPENTMQSLAHEFGISETAYVWPEHELGGWRLRWFTPAAEVKLCGHATVAAATAIWQHHQSSEPLTFHTLSGALHADLKEGRVELSFPARPPEECPIPRGVVDAVGLSEQQVLWCGRDVDDYLLLLKTEDEVRSLAPDFHALKNLETRGLIITACSGHSERDIVSRFFAPRVGIDEDPVTGSAHCCLAPFWAPRLGKNIFRAEQLSARGGQLEVELTEDRVQLRGQSFILVSGQVRIPSQ
jgi:PhzF family phenazine biosynthesis protein